MAIYKAQDIIYVAARLANILGAPGRALSVSEQSDCLNALNALLDAWNVDPLMIFTQEIYIFNLVPNQNVYTMGKDPSGIIIADFDVPRPDYISHANLITQTDSNTGGTTWDETTSTWNATTQTWDSFTPVLSANVVRIPMQILTDDGWSAIQVQATGSSIPQGLYNDGDSPIANIYFWPYPNAQAQVEMYVWKPALQFASMTDIFNLPSGYRKGVEYNLAVDLISMFPEARVSPQVMLTAREIRYEIQAHNSPSPVMSCDEALLSAKKSDFNYITGLPN